MYKCAYFVIMLFTETLVFISALVVLPFAGAILVRSLVKIAKFWGLSEYIVAFLLMSIATSIPEFFIGISSALQGAPSISLGNVLGTSLVSLTIIVGMVAIFSGGIKIESKISRNSFLLIFFIAFLPILLVIDGVISRIDGLLLILFFVLYVTKILKEEGSFVKKFDHSLFSMSSALGIFMHMRSFLFGVLLLVLSSFAIIWSSMRIVEGIDISLLFFGIVFVALGTALPDLFFGMKASFAKHHSMMLGNMLGSIALNATFVVGSVALISPIWIDFDNGLFLVSSFLFIAFVLFNIFSYSRSRVSRTEGFLLLLVYVAFLSIGFFG